MNAIDSIKQYKELLDEGIINQEDFAVKKKVFLTLGRDTGDSVSLLRAYKELLDSNTITQEEFDAKKKRLLEPTVQSTSMPSTPATTYYPVTPINAGIAPTNPGALNDGLKKSSAKIKKVLIAVIGVAVIAVIAVMAIPLLKAKMLQKDRNYKGLPAGVQLGDTLSTVISKTSELNAESSRQHGDTYYLENGKVYGHEFDRICFEFYFDQNELSDVSIYFSDPDLTMEILVEEVSESLGTPEKIDDDFYIWYLEDMVVCVTDHGYLNLSYYTEL